MKHVAALIAMIGISSAAVGVADCTDNVAERCKNLDTVSVTLDPFDKLDLDVQKRDDPRNVPELFSDPAETEQVRNQRDINEDLDKRGIANKVKDIGKNLPGKKPDDKKPDDKPDDKKPNDKKPDDKKPDDKKPQDSKSIPNGQGDRKDNNGNNSGKKPQNAIGKDSKKSAANMAVARAATLGYLTAGLVAAMVVAGIDIVAF
jgi:hypothetical protein